MTKKVVIGPGENNYETTDLTADEISEIETRNTALENAKAAVKADQVSGNQKLLDLGLTQAEATALTGFKPE